MTRLTTGQTNALKTIRAIQERYPDESWLPLDRTGIQRRTLRALEGLGLIEIRLVPATHYVSRGFGDTRYGYQRRDVHEWTVRIV